MTRTLGAGARLFGAAIAWVVFGALSLGCGKLDEKECGKLRETAFDVVNTPNYCSSDADCKLSPWPGCGKPINVAGFEKITTAKASFEKGKCEEKPLKCEPTPPLYCQEGLCAFKYPKKLDDRIPEGMTVH